MTCPDPVQPDSLGPLGRLCCALTAAAALGVVALGAGLTPDRRGHSTHTQLGMQRCLWRAEAGRPCPGCGMTTAFTLATHGRLASAFVLQPAGALAAVAAAVAFWVGLWGAATGSRAPLRTGRLLRPVPLLIAALVWVLSWVYTLSTG